MSRNTPGGDWFGYIKSRVPKNRTSKKRAVSLFLFFKSTCPSFFEERNFLVQPFFLKGENFHFFKKESFLLRSFFAVHVFFSLFFSLSLIKKRRRFFSPSSFFFIWPLFLHSLCGGHLRTAIWIFFNKLLADVINF